MCNECGRGELYLIRPLFSAMPTANARILFATDLVGKNEHVRFERGRNEGTCNWWRSTAPGTKRGMRIQAIPVALQNNLVGVKGRLLEQLYAADAEQGYSRHLSTTERHQGSIRPTKAFLLPEEGGKFFLHCWPL